MTRLALLVLLLLAAAAPADELRRPLPVGSGPTHAYPPTLAGFAARVQAKKRARKHRALKAALIARGVPPAKVAALEAKFGDGDFWATLLKYLLDYGLSALLKLIESWLS